MRITIEVAEKVTDEADTAMEEAARRLARGSQCSFQIDVQLITHIEDNFPISREARAPRRERRNRDEGAETTPYYSYVLDPYHRVSCVTTRCAKNMNIYIYSIGALHQSHSGDRHIGNGGRQPRGRRLRENEPRIKKLSLLRTTGRRTSSVGVVCSVVCEDQTGDCIRFVHSA